MRFNYFLSQKGVGRKKLSKFKELFYQDLDYPSKIYSLLKIIVGEGHFSGCGKPFGRGDYLRTDGIYKGAKIIFRRVLGPQRRRVKLKKLEGIRGVTPSLN